MVQRVRGERRIDLAKAVLRDLVSTRLPAGAPVAVRVLGDRTDVCGTRLVVPLGPLDAAAVIAGVDTIAVDQEADTPLAAALRAVPDDLSGSEGTRIVLLITDSEEVWPHPDLCGADPGDAIRDLRRRGIDARLNIVGMQVGARKAKAQLRRWARLGNGTYFEARDAEELGRSIRTAVSAPFRVLDQAGNEVASGTVDGGPVPLPPGTYSIVVLTDPVVRFDGIEVGPGQPISLALPTPEPDASPAPVPSGAP
jgi:Ca-activated chloride channel family protein